MSADHLRPNQSYQFKFACQDKDSSSRSFGSRVEPLSRQADSVVFYNGKFQYYA